MKELPDAVFQAVANLLDTGLVILDAEDTVLYWNRFMASHCRPARDPLGLNFFAAFPELPVGLFRRKIALARTLGVPAFTAWRERPQSFPLFHGRTFIGGDELLRHDVSIFPIGLGDGEAGHVCIAAYEVSEVAAKESALHLANHQLTELSRTDLLTNLSNRREIERILQRAEEETRRYGNPFSVLLIDVDHFKRVNDTHGHAAGDEALRYMGRALKASLREPDSAARFGGEEFLVCLPRTLAAGAFCVAERLRQEIEQSPVGHAPDEFHITVSIGAAEWHNGLEHYLELLERADRALYRAKHGGRNRTVMADSDAT